MRSKQVLVLAVLLVACSFAYASDVAATRTLPHQGLNVGTRSNGTFGSFSVSGAQTDALEVTVDVSATTAGNGTNTALNVVYLGGQVYNMLWASHTFATSGSTVIPNSSAQQSFSQSWSLSVPAPGDYVVWGAAFAGVLHGTTTQGGYCAGAICYTQAPGTCCYPATTDDQFYVDNQQPPTATPDPNAGGQPIPTINGWGIAAMMLLLAGGAILLITRRS
jgi:hypothetical protein